MLFFLMVADHRSYDAMFAMYCRSLVPQLVKNTVIQKIHHNFQGIPSAGPDECAKMCSNVKDCAAWTLRLTCVRSFLLLIYFFLKDKSMLAEEPLHEGIKHKSHRLGLGNALLQ